MNNVVLFNLTDFNNEINEINIKYKDNIVITMFSKNNCKYCDECYYDFVQASNKLKNTKYVFSKINVSLYPEINTYIKNNMFLLENRTKITYPIFIIYTNSKINKEYNGNRQMNDFILYLKDVEIKDSRLVNKVENIFPIRNYQIYNLYLTARNCFWIEKELDFSTDKYDWDNKLNKDERFFLSNILAFFSQSDQIVNTNLEERFIVDVNNLPTDLRIYTKLFYNFQKTMEDIHSITYESLLDIYITDFKEKNIYKNAIQKVPAIKKKSIWASKWIDDKVSSFGTRLIAFAVLEGIFFSGSFCAIFWIKEKNILNGLCKSNEFISRDEGMHYMFAITLYNILKARDDYNIECDNNTIIKIVREAVEIEKEFITSSFNCKLIGMNATEMKKYIEFVADKLLENLNISKFYNTKNPFQFMENIGLQNKTNFFEHRVTEYSKVNSSEEKNIKLTLDDDF